jgi:predicted RNase H-like nuclease (RuvC/YqgF family)
VFLYIEDVL